MTQTQTQAVRPFGIRDKVGYMFGDFGNDFSFILASSFLALFWTDGLGMAPAIGGTIMGVARIVDAFTDVGMGMLVDRSRTHKEGKFRPWIRRGMFPVAVASFIMYLNFAADWSQTTKIIYMTVTYLLWGSFCYTFINIPYGSMAAVISPDASDRANLSVFRSMGAALAQLFITVSVPLLVNEVVDGKSTFSGQKMMMVAAVCAILSVICYFLCYSLVRERVHVPDKPRLTKEEKAAQRAQADSNAPTQNIFVVLITNRALIALILAALLLLFASLMAMSMSSYLWKDYFGDLTLASRYNLIAVIPTFLLAPFVAKASAKFGKKEICTVMTALSAVSYLLVYFLHFSANQVIPYIVVIFFGLIGVAVFNLLIWAFITDIIDYQEVRSNSRDDGTVYAVYSWARKLGQALAALAQGFILTYIGYQSSTTAVEQSQTTKEGLYTFTSLLPGILYALVCLVLLFIYPLSRKVVAENTAILKSRHAGQTQQENA